MVKIIIPGEPRGWKRAQTNGKRRYTAPDMAGYQRSVAWIAKQNGVRPIDGPVSLNITAYFEVPASVSAKKRTSLIGTYVTKAPDADNIGKMIADSLQGIAFKDDAQVASVSVVKVWSYQASVEVDVSPLQAQQARAA